MNTDLRWRYMSRADQDVDHVAVERAAMGDPPPTLTCAEREAVVQRLHALRLTDQQIADRTGMCDQTVLRIRRRLGLESHHRWVAA